MSSILEHKDWPTLRPFLRVERYGRDTGPRGARSRLECRRPGDGRVMRQLLALSMPCVHCGRTVHPIRERQGMGNRMYFTCTCGLDVTFVCARSGEAREEYRKVIAALADVPPDAEQSVLALEPDDEDGGDQN